MYHKSVVHYITKVCIDILFYAGIVCCILIPFSSKWLFTYFNIANEKAVFMKSVLLISGISSVYILWQLKVIFRTLLEGNPFIYANVSCLRKIA
ncbi:MAG: hypothetical protein PHE29_13885, partial [Tissierellia bacterium]|nr:hypothetical protein [Tissierellia bacterium]